VVAKVIQPKVMVVDDFPPP